MPLRLQLNYELIFSGRLLMNLAEKPTIDVPLATWEEISKDCTQFKNVYNETRNRLKTTDKLAIWITAHIGTMGFFAIILVWSVLWLGWNFCAPKALVFDPPMGFVFWLFISNLIQILIMPLIMVGQNVQDAHAEVRAEHDLAINIKAEQEVGIILRRLECQQALLLQILVRLEKQPVV